MRIAILTHTLSNAAAGLFEVARAHANYLSELGATVGVFGYLKRGEGLAPGAFAERVQVFVEHPLGPFPLGLSIDLLRDITRWAPDLVHTHGIWTGMSMTSLTASKVCRVPLVVSPHGMLDQWALRRSVAKKWLASVVVERKHLNHAAALHALCAPETSAIRAWGLSQPIFEIPNGIAVSRTATKRPPPWERDERKTMLFLGRIHEKKGIFQLVKAWASIHPKRAGWVLRIAGWGSMQDEHRLRELLAGTADVEFIGAQYGEEKEACYQNADAFILPSFSEGMPMTVLEAWSYGVPTLITEACNLNSSLGEGAAISISLETGELERSLVRFVEMGDVDRQKVGSKGKDYCLANYQWLAVVRRLFESYGTLVES